MSESSVIGKVLTKVQIDLSNDKLGVAYVFCEATCKKTTTTNKKGKNIVSYSDFKITENGKKMIEEAGNGLAEENGLVFERYYIMKIVEKYFWEKE